jgi:signal transduction histidine kinase
MRTSHRRERIELQWGDRWFDVTVDPVLDEHQALQGAVHAIRDITERKRSEAALRESEAALRRSREELRTLAAGLLTAQEEERRRLSRELHDDLNQKLAMLAVDLESLEQHLPLSPQAIRAQLGSLKCRVVELSDDLRRMASQLHPSVLEHLGLVVALKSYCEELSKRERIEARLTHHNVPTQLPLDTALCLYRVVQEGLRNVARHSSSPSVTVSLTATRGSIRLSITDLGVGFDPLSVKSRGGLGLISMEERVRLVRGHFAVHSQPGRGVRIEVRVPLPAKAAALSA